MRKKIKIGESLAKLQPRRWLSGAVDAPGQHAANDEQFTRHLECGDKQPNYCHTDFIFTSIISKVV